jgi:hypothetical protein
VRGDGLEVVVPNFVNDFHGFLWVCWTVTSSIKRHRNDYHVLSIRPLNLGARTGPGETGSPTLPMISTKRNSA